MFESFRNRLCACVCVCIYICARVWEKERETINFFICIVKFLVFHEKQMYVRGLAIKIVTFVTFASLLYFTTRVFTRRQSFVLHFGITSETRVVAQVAWWGLRVFFLAFTELLFEEYSWRFVHLSNVESEKVIHMFCILLCIFFYIRGLLC